MSLTVLVRASISLTPFIVFVEIAPLVVVSVELLTILRRVYSLLRMRRRRPPHALSGYIDWLGGRPCWSLTHTVALVFELQRNDIPSRWRTAGPTLTWRGRWRRPGTPHRGNVPTLASGTGRRRISRSGSWHGLVIVWWNKRIASRLVVTHGTLREQEQTCEWCSMPSNSRDRSAGTTYGRIS